MFSQVKQIIKSFSHLYLYINRSTNYYKSHAHERVLAKLMLERMGDYTKGRDRARAMSRADEVHQFFVLPCFLLPGHPGDHHGIQDEEDGTMCSFYTLMYSQVKQFLTKLLTIIFLHK